MAREYFDEWFPTASDFHGSANDAITNGKTKLAAFLMHQAAERLYHCVLLVCTFYTTHVTNLGFLHTQAERDRTSVGKGKSVSGRIGWGVRRISKNKKTK